MCIAEYWINDVRVCWSDSMNKILGSLVALMGAITFIYIMYKEHCKVEEAAKEIEKDV
jgi:hypothetical protein